VYLDESGVDNKQYRKYARSEVGTAAYGDVRGASKERYSIIAALNLKKIKAPIVFKGSTTSELFNEWLKSHLLPEIGKNKTIVMDNAKWHKSGVTKEIIENSGNKILYLPTYSPDFNPIENYWAITKKRLKQKQFKYKKLISNLHAALKYNVQHSP
jgi:transposase